MSYVVTCIYCLYKHVCQLEGTCRYNMCMSYVIMCIYCIYNGHLSVGGRRAGIICVLCIYVYILFGRLSVGGGPAGIIYVCLM